MGTWNAEVAENIRVSGQKQVILARQRVVKPLTRMTECVPLGITIIKSNAMQLVPGSVNPGLLNQ